MDKVIARSCWRKWNIGHDWGGQGHGENVAWNECWCCFVSAGCLNRELFSTCRAATYNYFNYWLISYSASNGSIKHQEQWLDIQLIILLKQRSLTSNHRMFLSIDWSINRLFAAALATCLCSISQCCVNRLFCCPQSGHKSVDTVLIANKNNFFTFLQDITSFYRIPAVLLSSEDQDCILLLHRSVSTNILVIFVLRLPPYARLLSSVCPKTKSDVHSPALLWLKVPNNLWLLGVSLKSSGFFVPKQRTTRNGSVESLKSYHRGWVMLESPVLINNPINLSWYIVVIFLLWGPIEIFVIAHL